MPEYVMGEDEDRSAVARRLINQVGPERADQVVWQPKADVPGGGVFLVPDDVADQIGRDATTEHGTPKAGEYPYDGAEEGDPERRETDLAGQTDENGEPDSDPDGGDPAAAEDTAPSAPLPTRRRRAPTANTTEQ